MARGIGRDGEIATVLEALADRRAVLVEADVGMGKTALLEAVASLLPPAVPVWVRGSADQRDADLSAFTFLVDTVGQPPGASNLARMAEVLRWFRSPDDALVCIVDDAHLIDDMSAGVVLQLALGRVCPVLVAVERGRPAPDAIIRLSKDEVATVIDLPPLDARAVAILAEQTLGGLVGAALLKTLIEASHGSPRFLREIVTTSVASSAITKRRGVWIATRPLAPGASMHDNLRSRLEQLPGGVRDLVVLVAICGRVPYELLAAIGGRHAIGAAVGAGLIRRVIGDDRLVIIDHPLLGDLVARSVPEVDTNHMLKTVIDAAVVERVIESHPSLVISWLLRRTDLAHEDVQVLLDAARHAWSTDIAERLIEAARRCGATNDQLLAVSTVMPHLSSSVPPMMHAEADASAVVVRALALGEQAMLGNRSFEEARRAIADARAALSPSARRDTLHVLDLTLRIYGGERFDAVAPAATELLHRLANRPAEAARLAVSAIPLVTMAGMAEDAAELGLRTLATAPDETAVDHTTVDSVRSTTVCALVFAGQFDAADALIDSAPERDVPGVFTATSLRSLIHGVVSMWSGRPHAAARALAEAAAQFGDVDLIGLRAWALHELAHVRSWLGSASDIVAANGPTEAGGSRGPTRVELSPPLDDSADVDIDSVAPPPGLLRPIVEHSMAQRLVYAGRRPEAFALAAQTAELSRERGNLLGELLATHLCARVSPMRRHAVDAASLATRTQGRLLPAIADHVVALVDTNPEALEQVGETFESIGTLALAVEAYAQAAAVYEKQRAKAPSRRCRSAALRVTHLLRADPRSGDRVIPTFATPALLSSGLTDREHHVATLAAAGQSNRAIGEALGLSQRTVESYLRSAYAKLGVNDRAVLEQALRTSGV